MATFDVIPDILEVTLRDGSYLIDFQFTAEDTATIAAASSASASTGLKLATAWV